MGSFDTGKLVQLSIKSLSANNPTIRIAPIKLIKDILPREDALD